MPLDKSSIGDLHSVMPKSLDSISDTEETASWIALLASLYRSTTDSITKLASQPHKIETRLTLPLVESVERSWDFMPPDVSRPMALTTIHCICVIAVRLGMTWKDVRPTEGVMTAEGNGFTLTSSLVRGVGLVTTFTSEGRSVYAGLLRKFPPLLPAGPSVYNLVPTLHTDRLVFGIITTETRWDQLPFWV